MLPDNVFAFRSPNVTQDPPSTPDSEQWLDRFNDAFYHWSMNELTIVRHLAHVPCGSALIALEGLDAGWIPGTCWTAEGLRPARPAIVAWVRDYVAANPPPQRLGVVFEKRHAERYNCLACWLPPYGVTFDEPTYDEDLAAAS